MGCYLNGFVYLVRKYNCCNNCNDIIAVVSLLIFALFKLFKNETFDKKQDHGNLRYILGSYLCAFVLLYI